MSDRHLEPIGAHGSQSRHSARTGTTDPIDVHCEGDERHRDGSSRSPPR